MSRHETGGAEASATGPEQEGRAFDGATGFRWYARDFERREMVSWFDPGELAATGVRALMASVFGSYADKRDVMAVGSDARVCSDLRHRSDDVWIDYVADLGDGWAATYTIAWLLGRERLGGAGADGAPDPIELVGFPEELAGRGLPRGDLLVLGGDEVYPTATREEYHHRFVGPYTASLPHVDVGEGDVPPLMFAIPGNHDWYDGLASFTRLFCQERWVGGRQTQQARSYFAIRLPGDWWLWGVDTQLHADFDRPQLEYFTRVATGELTEGEPVEGFFEGQKVILCVPSPEWVATAGVTEAGARERMKRGAGPYANLDYLEERIIRKHGGELVVTLTGDTHHYAHYVEKEDESAPAEGRTRQHKITAGGGGAYTRATHALPEGLELGARQTPFDLVGKFPDDKDSIRLVKKARWAFVAKRGNWPFTGLLASLYLWFAWIVQSTSKMLDTSPLRNESFMEQALGLGVADFGALLSSFWRVAAHGPSVALTALVVVGALVVFSAASHGKIRPAHVAVGGAHGVLHVLLAVTAMWGFAKINLGWLGLEVDHPLQTALFVVETFLIGGFAGAALMGFYLTYANRWFGMNDNEVLSCLSDPDFKNFLRMRLGPDGLTIYPIGVRTVLRDDEWSAGEHAERGPLTGDAWWRPAGTRKVVAELLSRDAYPDGIRIPTGKNTSSGGATHG